MPQRPQTASLRSRRHRSRTLLACAVVVLATAVGAGLGGWVGWSIVLNVARQQLGADAAQLMSASQRLEEEVTQTLATFNRSPRTFCNNLELDRMRELVYRTRYIKDIGRVRDARLHCTAGMWRIDDPPPMPKADLVTAGNEQIVASTPLMVASTVHAPVVTAGETNVVLDTDAFPALDIGGMRYMVGYSDGNRLLRLYGDALEPDPNLALSGEPFEQDGGLFVPRCSESGAICVVTSESRSALWNMQRPLLALCAALGGLAGCAIALAGLLLRSRSLTFDARLKRAIAEGALHVEYQPVVALADGRTVGAEALVRWRDSDGSLVSPTRFIPVAEANGWISQITTLVLQQVAHDFSDLLAGEGTFSINVNISAKDLDDARFHATLEGLLREHGIAPERLGIELTEHSTAARAIAVAGTQRLSEAGHHVYIDDFGTGYSSLAYLNELDVYAIKIDRSFTARVDTDAVTFSVVQQILAMARTLELAVVVEGVETQAQADWFRQAGAATAQGWLFGRPASADALRARLLDEADGLQEVL